MFSFLQVQWLLKDKISFSFSMTKSVSRENSKCLGFMQQQVEHSVQKIAKLFFHTKINRKSLPFINMLYQGLLKQS